MKKTHPAPVYLTGDEFERRITPRLDQYEDDGIATFARPGVNATERTPYGDGRYICRLIPSLPDYDGLIADGPPVTFDAKVSSAASFALSKYVGTKYARSRQLRHMETRARFGAVSFFLIHWNLRRLKKREVPAQTWAFPVDENLPFWRRFHAGEAKSINLDDCREYGVAVNWITRSGERNPKPDVLHAVHAIVRGNERREQTNRRAAATFPRRGAWARGPVNGEKTSGSVAV